MIVRCRPVRYCTYVTGSMRNDAVLHRGTLDFQVYICQISHLVCDSCDFFIVSICSIIHNVTALSPYYLRIAFILCVILSTNLLTGYKPGTSDATLPRMNTITEADTHRIQQITSTILRGNTLTSQLAVTFRRLLGE